MGEPPLKPSPIAIWQLEYPSGKELKWVEEAKRYHLDIVEVSFIKRLGSETMNML